MNYATLIKERRNALERDRGAFQRIHEQLDRTRNDAVRAEQNVSTLELTQELSFELERNWRKSYEEHVAATCSEGASLVFGEPVTVSVHSAIKAGASAIKFMLDTGYGDVDIMSADGRSMREVIAFLQRVITIAEARPALTHFITLDEEFGGVDEANVPAVAALLRKLVDETGLQILFVTHNRSFADMADRVYEVPHQPTEGVTKLRLLCNRSDNHLYDEVDDG